MSIGNLYVLEVKSYLKSKKFLSILVAIGAMFLLETIIFLLGNYNGPVNQSVLYWTVRQIYNLRFSFIMVWLTISMTLDILKAKAEGHGLELDKGSRPDKHRLYFSKVFTFISFSVLVYTVIILMQFLVYQVASLIKANYFSGHIFAGNTLPLFISLFKLWACTFLIPGILTLALSKKLKEIHFVVVTLILNTMLREIRLPTSLEWLNLWQYVARIIDLEAKGMSVYPSNPWPALGYYSAIIIVVSAILIFLGSKLFNGKKENLNH